MNGLLERYAIAEHPTVQAADAKVEAMGGDEPDYPAKEAEAETAYNTRRREVAWLLEGDICATAVDVVRGIHILLEAKRTFDEYINVVDDNFLKPYPSGYTALHADVRATLERVLPLCYLLRDICPVLMAYEMEIKQLASQEKVR